MYLKLKDGKSKVLTLSYDDGVAQDIKLVNIMNKYGLKGTFNINTGLYAPEEAVREKLTGRLKLSEMQELYTTYGHEVAVHGLTHQSLDKIKIEEVPIEILEDRKNIEKQFGTFARGMAYPNGSYNDDVIEALRICGICYSRTVRSTEYFDFPQNWLALNPTCHHNNPRLMELAKRFVESKPMNLRNNWMFYLWGHSYEFDNNDNWDVIEKFAEYAGGRDDVWYATNIEVYDYIKAYEGLQTNVDKTVIYNPSVTDVWFVKDDTIYCVRGGETLRL